MKRNIITVFVSFALFAVIAGVYWFIADSDEPQIASSPSTVGFNDVEVVGESTPDPRLVQTFPDTDFSASLVNYEKVLSGGVRKDGIPAISNPQFDDLSVPTSPSETLGILVEIDDQKRFYPYNILVSHEIVNDSIGDTDFAVTFCPLCGSAIVFDRNVNGEVKEFGVSGFLFESNLIMYDRTDTPSLWSQARGEAIIGDQAGTQLDLIDFQLLTLDEVRSAHANAVILSTDTGFARSYSFDPYSGYDEVEETYFPISVNDGRFPAKEVFFIVPDDDRSIAVQVGNLDKGGSATNDILGLQIEKSNDGEVMVTNQAGQERIGYYEMWFSWAQHHQDDGEVWAL